MPKTKSEFNKEIKIRASEEFLEMYYNIPDWERKLLVGNKNFSEFIRAAVIFWFELHLPKLLDQKKIPEVQQYGINQKKIAINLDRLNNWKKHKKYKERFFEFLKDNGASERLISFYIEKKFNIGKNDF